MLLMDTTIVAELGWTVPIYLCKRPAMSKKASKINILGFLVSNTSTPVPILPLEVVI